MGWGKYFVITVALLVFLWSLLFYGYGNFILIDTIVPYPGMEIDEWLSSYYISGAISGIAGLICSAIWFSMGNSSDGKSSLGVRYGVVWILSLLLSVAVNFLLVPDLIDGAGLAKVFVILMAPLLYYLSSLFAAPNAGKYIPPLSGLIH